MLHITNHPTFDLWTISSPTRGNAIGLTLAKLINQAAQKSDTNVPLVITAAPIATSRGQIWIAGGDLIELAALKTQSEGRSYAELMSRAFLTLHESKRMIITAIDGAAIGGGAELALVGDIRLATKQSSLEFRQLKAGLATGYGSARRLVDLLGLGRTERLLYFSETLTAEEAESIGLIHRILPSVDELKAEIESICKNLATLSFEGLSAQKQMLRAAVDSNSHIARQKELDLFTQIWGNTKHKEFLAAFKGNNVLSNNKNDVI